MSGLGYKVSLKTLQFPLGLDTHIATRTLLHKSRRLNKRKSSKSSVRKKSKKINEEEKENLDSRPKNQKNYPLTSETL